MNKIIASGKRKTAIAKAEIKEGTGKITINKKNYETFHKFRLPKRETSPVRWNL